MAITRKSKIVSIGATETTLLLAGAAEEIAIVSLIIGNIDTDATVSLHLTKDGDSLVDIVTDLAVAAGEAVEFLIGGKSAIFLENDDELSATASVADDLAAVLSYLVET